VVQGAFADELTPRFVGAPSERLVDQDGDVIDILVQSRRDQRLVNLPDMFKRLQWPSPMQILCKLDTRVS
jgi:hypothetical protein